MGYRIGIDVGGTNTDAVLMRGNDVIAAVKRFTTQDVGSGVVDAVTSLLSQAGTLDAPVRAVMIGTTQFVNAFIQRRNMEPVAIIRIALPKGDGVPPLAGWPEDIADGYGSKIYMVGGGAFYDGRDYAPLDEEVIADAAREASAAGIRAFAISANFAPIRPDLEERAGAIVRQIVPDARITLSGRVGGLGLVDRENAAIINAMLSGFAVDVVQSMENAISHLGINAPLYISQNDGTLITTAVAAAYPIFTCAAGPTNSLRGAAFLTGIEDAIVADIGGTTTDVGFLSKGFPRETATANMIGGVRTNFRIPDTLSIGVGGGSIVRQDSGGRWVVGPQSVGFRLREEGKIFGGSTLTATDIAVRAGQADIGDASLVAGIDDDMKIAALDSIHAQIADAIDQMKTSPAPMPLILVGGGHILVSRPLPGVSEMLRPAHADVANAVGAAIALVSGRVDAMFDTNELGREGALELAKKQAIDAAIEQGARPEEVEIVEIVELPMTHMKTGATQIKVRAVGPIAELA